MRRGGLFFCTPCRQGRHEARCRRVVEFGIYSAFCACPCASSPYLTRILPPEKDAGVIDHDLAKLRHTCRPPSILRFGASKPGDPPPAYLQHPEGTRYHCGCGTVWVVRWRVGRGLQPNGLAWAREGCTERRKRLGLRWWKRV